MAVPDFQSLMLPILRIAGDGQEHTSSEVTELLARQFSLTEADLRELLPSGRQAKFTNRIGWATTYLRKTKLLEGTGRGRFRIIDRGLAVLRENPIRVDLKYLNRFSELATFRGDTPQEQITNADVTEVAAEATSQTPREILEASYQVLRRELAQELCIPRFITD